MPLIRACIRRKAFGHVFSKSVPVYRRVVEHMLSGHWQMQSKVNPQNDSAVIMFMEMKEKKKSLSYQKTCQLKRERNTPY